MQKIFQNPFDKPYIFERQTSVQIRFHSWKDANLVTFSRWVVHFFTQKVNSLLEKISFDRKSSLVHTYVEIRKHCSSAELYTSLTHRPITHWTNFQCFLFQCFSFTFTLSFFRTIVYSENCCKIEHELVNLIVSVQFNVNWRIIIS